MGRELIWSPGPAWREGLGQRPKGVGGHWHIPAPLQTLDLKGVSVALRLPDVGQNGERTPIQGTRTEEGAGDHGEACCVLGSQEVGAARRDTQPPGFMENPQWRLLGSQACIPVMSPHRQTVARPGDPQASRVTLSGLTPKNSPVLGSALVLTACQDHQVPTIEKVHAYSRAAGPPELRTQTTGGVSETRKSLESEDTRPRLASRSRRHRAACLPIWKEGDPTAGPPLPRPGGQDCRHLARSHRTGEWAWWAPRGRSRQVRAGA